MLYVVGLLKNIVTNKFHCILFKPAPFPGGVWDIGGSVRYKSFGNDPNGYDTVEEARNTLHNSRNIVVMTNCIWEWDPNENEIPAMVQLFPTDINSITINNW